MSNDFVEHLAYGPVTMPYGEWVDYVSDPMNRVLGEGGVDPGSRSGAGFGGGKGAHDGHVRQGMMPGWAEGFCPDRRGSYPATGPRMGVF